MRHITRSITAAMATILLGTAVLTGCGSEDPDPGPVTVQVTFSDGKVDPQGVRVEASSGKPITFEVTADAPGTLHIHSHPEQEVAYEAGESSHEITVDTPGVVDVESHELEVTVVQLEVK